MTQTIRRPVFQSILSVGCAFLLASAPLLAQAQFQTYGSQQPNNAYGQGTYSQNAYGQGSYGQGSYGAPQNLPPLQGHVVTAPMGTYLTASMSSPLSSEYARVGDRLMATLGSDLAAGGSVIVPAGSQLEGQVVMAERAGRAGKNGAIDVRFTSAILPNGQRVPLSAKIQTQDGSGVIRGGTTKGRIGKAALRTGIGAGLGAALGTAMGPLSGGEVGRGAIYGTAVGGGIGAASAAWQKGTEAVLPAGQPIQVTLDQPLSATPYAGGYGGGYGQQPAYPQQQQQQQSPYTNYGGGYGY